jgi:hypothetical protein
VAALPLLRVRFLSDGHEAHINESDFDPALHERWVHMRPGAYATPEEFRAEVDVAAASPEPPKSPKRKGSK